MYLVAINRVHPLFPSAARAVRIGRCFAVVNSHCFFKASAPLKSQRLCLQAAHNLTRPPCHTNGEHRMSRKGAARTARIGVDRCQAGSSYRRELDSMRRFTILGYFQFSFSILGKVQGLSTLELTLHTIYRMTNVITGTYIELLYL